jgi:hypothetical protein
MIRTDLQKAEASKCSLDNGSVSGVGELPAVMNAARAAGAAQVEGK